MASSPPTSPRSPVVRVPVPQQSSAPAPPPLGLPSSSMRVLVTGGTGLVGSAIREVCAAELPGAHFVFLGSADADLLDRASTLAAFAAHRPTHVIHAAARVGGLFLNMRAPVELGRENMLMGDNVMEACRAHGCRLLSFLSTCIFPDATAYPIDEGMLHAGPPHSSNAPYAYAKRWLDTMTRSYRSEYGCGFTTVIPTNIYGPRDNYNYEDAHVIPALVHKAHAARAAGTPLTVSGSGAPLRQFIYARDLARLTLLALRAYDSAEPLILSVDAADEVSIRDVAEMVAEATGLGAGGLAWDHSKADGQFRKTASNAKLRAFLAATQPDFAFTPIREGIRETVEWFAANYDSARK